MSAYAMWQLRCDAEEFDRRERGCVETNDASGGETASHAREYAAAEGWGVRVHKGRRLDLCPTHLELFDRMKKARAFVRTWTFDETTTKGRTSK